MTAPPRRAKAVRLVANKLFTEPCVEAEVERFATAALRELAPPAPAASTPAPAENGVKLETGNGAAPAGPAGAPAAAGDDVGDAAAEAAPAGAGAGAEEEGDARRRCQLFCALCTKRHALMRTLFEVYGQV